MPSASALRDAVGVEPVVLEGSHVRLEPLRPEHGLALARAAAGPRDTYAFTLVPGDEREAAAYIDTALREQAAGRALPFATVARATGRVVGSTRFGNIEFWPWPAGNPHQRGAELPDAVEIGWTWLTAEAQRTAINTEAKLLMLTHAFEGWRVHRVTLQTDERNARSRAAISRLGARFDGVLRAARPASDGGIRDTAVYSILEGEWPAVKATLGARLAAGAAGAAAGAGPSTNH
ncbi:MAG: GNAT family N-acetyltransferase [Candidatus Rokubacteria bacterium]|nr:GNAT family N-acetyltransferase [Candidatus Rokubacteria bacterium]